MTQLVWGREKTGDLRDGRDKRDERPRDAGDGGGPAVPGPLSPDVVLAATFLSAA